MSAVDSYGLNVRRMEGKAERDRIETTVGSNVPIPDEDVRRLPSNLMMTLLQRRRRE